MKALVISDRQEIIDFVTPLLKENGFDLIHYRWIIKALDNIEEIQPDVIVLSAGEYPRHWKTLAGFVQSGIGGNDVKVYLYETSPLSEEDEKKAKGLGILSFTEAFSQSEEIEEKIEEEFEEEEILEDDSESENIQVEGTSEIEENPEEEIITERLYTNVEVAYNENYGMIHLCSGKYYEDDNLVEVEAKLTNGSYLKYISLFDGNHVRSYSATVEDAAEDFSSLRIKEL